MVIARGRGAGERPPPPYLEHVGVVPVPRPCDGRHDVVVAAGEGRGAGQAARRDARDSPGSILATANCLPPHRNCQLPPPPLLTRGWT